MWQKIEEARKALAGLLVPALVALGAALVDGAVTPEEWVGIVVAALATGTIVYAVENKPSGDAS